MQISILIPSRNGLEFLQWSYPSIVKNYENHDVELLILDDLSDKDDTWNWLVELSKNDSRVKIFRNTGKERLGISGGYKFLAQHATKYVICHWHNDMFMAEGTLDSVQKYLFSPTGGGMLYPERNVVLSLTRIEPPIYPPGPEKITWKEGPIEIEDWDEEKFNSFYSVAAREWNGKVTGGHFAPFFMFRFEYEKIGGNDTKTFPLQSREDSDFAFRLVLAGYETKQIPVFTYHFASRGNRRSKYEAGSFIDNPRWIEHNIRASRNFIRKWQTFNLHDEFLKPIPPVRYRIGFVIENCTIEQLYNLEPWCDHITVDLDEDTISRYIESEQSNTTVDLESKIDIYGRVSYIPNIIVQFDGSKLMKEDYINLTNLSSILSFSCDGPGEYELGTLKVYVKDLTQYQNSLIICE